ncbi:MAG: urate hydroxylase PuuD [Verrucomicrobia bacterium]|nr:urate hydroxylase PuuD [Verrucomicrobiota bacterium]
MTSYDLQSWLMFIVRRVHVFAAILWVGQTYLFHRIERNLQPDDEEGSLGHVDMVHGGGLFSLRKRDYPQGFSGPLMWFKWESLLTWVSGAILIAHTYYWGGLLVEVTEIDEWADAAAAGASSYVGGQLFAGLFIKEKEDIANAVRFCLTGRSLLPCSAVDR